MEISTACGKWWAQHLAGDPDAFRELYDGSYLPLLRYGYSLTPDLDLIRDAVQDVFLALWNRSAGSAPIDDPWFFLLTSLRNRLYDAGRREQTRQRNTTNAEPTATWQDSAEQQLLTTEQTERRRLLLRQYLDHLPQRQSEAIYLRYYEELDYPEIANIMNVERQVAYNYVHRGLLALRSKAGHLGQHLLALMESVLVGWLLW